jgi:hypothetical protein
MRSRSVRFGSMRETMACVDVGVALGYLEELDEATRDQSLRIVGTLVRLARA